MPSSFGSFVYTLTPFSITVSRLIIFSLADNLSHFQFFVLRTLHTFLTPCTTASTRLTVESKYWPVWNGGIKMRHDYGRYLGSLYYIIIYIYKVFFNKSDKLLFNIFYQINIDILIAWRQLTVNSFISQVLIKILGV